VNLDTKRFLDINADLMQVLLKHGDPVQGLKAMVIGTVTGAIQAGLSRQQFVDLLVMKYDQLLATKNAKTVEA